MQDRLLIWILGTLKRSHLNPVHFVELCLCEKIAPNSHLIAVDFTSLWSGLLQNTPNVHPEDRNLCTEVVTCGFYRNNGPYVCISLNF